ncbi:hypothetical protein [Phyllobacterium sophorae]|uniref:Lipoprotein n=1 Tax=Phyllobacterium sophorae TaxID=1520277 RepID=A0A2P7AN14_9HYPH|nr:hypothetical protein [Phyllobacterium sophorae]PSH55613.1 hypothetical protein CU103_30360 [Phyllobacterium sophorae]
MESDRILGLACLGIILAVTALSGCGSIKEKTAPCKRPAELSSYGEDPRQDCGPMQAINSPAGTYATIGVK